MNVLKRSFKIECTKYRQSWHDSLIHQSFINVTQTRGPSNPYPKSQGADNPPSTSWIITNRYDLNLNAQIYARAIKGKHLQLKINKGDDDGPRGDPGKIVGIEEGILST